MRLFLEMTDELLKKVKRQPIAPILMVCSESDPCGICEAARVTNRQTQQQFFQAVVEQQPRSWYHCFDQRYKIRHRMMTRIEGNLYQDLVINIAKAYIAQDEVESFFR